MGKNFQSLLKKPYFQLPEPIVMGEVDKGSDPNYCPHHCEFGHTIEDHLTFKN